MFVMFRRIENLSKDSRYRILIIFFFFNEDELSKDHFILINLFKKKLISYARLIFVN